MPLSLSLSLYPFFFFFFFFFFFSPRCPTSALLGYDIASTTSSAGHTRGRVRCPSIKKPNKSPTDASMQCNALRLGSDSPSFRYAILTGRTAKPAVLRDPFRWASYHHLHIGIIYIITSRSVDIYASASPRHLVLR
ncbi:hypothetical protein F4815DRAFT_488874 [Daldinia loculata]|nr:hypothetical protein F4815DRAFT_488874 [Daldinia loculata]